jgi:hypothetical protein
LDAGFNIELRWGGLLLKTGNSMAEDIFERAKRERKRNRIARLLFFPNSRLGDASPLEAVQNPGKHDLREGDPPGRTAESVFRDSFPT